MKRPIDTVVAIPVGTNNSPALTVAIVARCSFAIIEAVIFVIVVGTHPSPRPQRQLATRHARSRRLMSASIFRSSCHTGWPLSHCHLDSS
jgi:hypothetical protein